MSNLNQFLNGMPIGTVAELVAPPADGNWLPADGRSVARGDYPVLSAMFGVGTCTFTARTLAATPAARGIAASATYFVASGASGATGIQYSTDGTTWSTTSVSITSGTISSIVWTGIRFVATYSATNQPVVTTGDNPNSTWTATTGGPATVATSNGLAYSPSLGMTVAITTSSTNSIYTLADGATAWTTQTAPTTAARNGVCWTGSRFIVITQSSQSYLYSTDGITWTEAFFPNFVNMSFGANPQIYSNGSGLVVARMIDTAGSFMRLLVSTDHGVTWRNAQVPVGFPESATSSTSLSYAGGVFFLYAAYCTLCSTDGVTWNALQQSNPNLNGLLQVFAKKGSVFVGLGQSSSTAASFTESATTFNLPVLTTSATVGTLIGYGNPYIKVR